MINKYLFQFIVYTLFGLVAIADPGKEKQSRTSDYVAHDMGTEVKNFVIGHEAHVVNSHKLPPKKQTKFRTRFRAVSYFQISPGHTNEPVEAVLPPFVNALPKKTSHIPPFYYVFLFRLTPF